MCEKGKVLVSVLYRDYAGILAPLERLYFSTSSKFLVSRHPLVSIEEVIACYCPQCLTRYTDEEAVQLGNRCPTCFQCINCRGVLVKKPTSSSSSGSSSSGAGNSDTVLLVCTTCGLECCKPVFDPKCLIPGSSGTENPVDTMFTDMVEAIRKVNRMQAGDGEVNTSSAETIWRMEDLETKLKSRSELDYQMDFFSTQSDKYKSPGQATGMPLRTKKTLRSRHDFEAGKMNILVQTKQSPLDGDSSMKLQKGKWWIKDSSAIHDVPQITVVKLQNSFVVLRIVNPKDVDAQVIIASNNNIELEYFECDDVGFFSWNQCQNIVSVPQEEVATMKLNGYEDELLKENDNSGDDVVRKNDFDAADNSNQWANYVDGNKGFLKVPISNILPGCRNTLPLMLTWVVSGVELKTEIRVNFTC